MEHRQMAIYLLALILGMSLGSEPGFRAAAALALWPALASCSSLLFANPAPSPESGHHRLPLSRQHDAR